MCHFKEVTMSCKDCEIAQDITLSDIEEPICYIRVGNANVMVIGCKKHLEELIEKLRGEK
jgi:hypothetical protein